METGAERVQVPTNICLYRMKSIVAILATFSAASQPPALKPSSLLEFTVKEIRALNTHNPGGMYWLKPPSSAKFRFWVGAQLPTKLDQLNLGELLTEQDTSDAKDAFWDIATPLVEACVKDGSPEKCGQLKKFRDTSAVGYAMFIKFCLSSFVPDEAARFFNMIDNTHNIRPEDVEKWTRKSLHELIQQLGRKSYDVTN